MSPAMPHSRPRVTGLINTEVISGGPDIAINGLASTGYADNSAICTFQKTINTGDNTILLVGVSVRAFVAVSSITFNGKTLTKIDHAQYTSGNNGRFELWYLLAPDVGTYNVLVTLSGSDYPSCGAVAFDHVNQANPYSNVTTNNGSGVTTATITVPTGLSSLAFAGISHEGVGTKTGDQTQAYSVTVNGNWWGGAGYMKADASATFTWSINTNTWGMVGISLNHV